MNQVTFCNVCVSVCELFTQVSCAKTAELIEMPFGWLISVSPRNHVLDGIQIPAVRSTFERTCAGLL